MKNLLVLFFALFGLIGWNQTTLNIPQALEKALGNNYQVKIVAANYEISKLQNSWGQAGMIPTFSLDLVNNLQIQDNTNNPATFFPGVLFNDNFQASLSMNWTIFSGFGIKINKERFDQLQAQTKGNAVVVIENTIYDVILAYYTAVVQERKLTLLKDLLSYSKEKLKYYELKNDLGINTSFDLIQFENQVLADSSNLLLQQLSYDNAQRNLNMVMGEDIEQRYQLTDSLNLPEKTASYDELKQQMMGNNANLKNQFINYELQDLNQRAQKSAWYPVVSLNLSTAPSLGYFRVYGDEGFSSSTSAWAHNARVNVRYDLFTGWNRKRNNEIAEIQLDIASMQIDDLKLNLSHQLKGIYDLHQIRVRVEDMTYQQLDKANKLWQTGQDKYELGLINVFNLNDIRTTYEQTALNYYDRTFELIQSYYDLMRISGGIAQQYNIAGNIDGKK